MFFIISPFILNPSSQVYLPFNHQNRTSQGHNSAQGVKLMVITLLSLDLILQQFACISKPFLLFHSML